MNHYCEHCIYKIQFPFYGCAKGRLEFHENLSATTCPEKTVMEVVYSDKTTSDSNDYIVKIY